MPGRIEEVNLLHRQKEMIISDMWSITKVHILHDSIQWWHMFGALE